MKVQKIENGYIFHHKHSTIKCETLQKNGKWYHFENDKLAGTGKTKNDAIWNAIENRMSGQK